MELILEFLDNSTPKKFLIPPKATALNALRIILFKQDLDIHVDDLSELSLALISSNFYWKNICWLDSSAILQNATSNGSRHVFLLKKYFRRNQDIQIAGTNSFLSSVLYSQFYKLFLSSTDIIDYSVLISLSARLLQCEFFECEITLNSLRCNNKLSMILPSKYHNYPSIDSQIFNYWHGFKHLNESDSKSQFMLELLSSTQLYFHQSYDIIFGKHSVLYISPHKLLFTFPDSIQESSYFYLSSLTSLSFSLIAHTISCNFSNEVICYSSDFLSQIVSIIYEMVDISPVCLDNISTDVSQSDFNMDVQLYQYLKFFDCEDSVSFSSILLCPSPHINLSKNVDIPMVQSNLKTLSGKVSSSVSTSISNDLSSFDSQYDTLLSAKNSNAFIDLPNLSRSLTRIHTPPTPRISNENHPDHMSTISDLSDLNALESFHEFSDNFYEHCNPIYTEASTFSTNQDTYQKCFDDYESNMNISLKNADNGIVPVSFSLISNLSSFETFGDIYNDVHDLQIDSRFSNGLRTSLAQSNFSSTVDSNIYMHSNSVFEPICRSSSFREGSKYFVKVISEFSTFVSFHYIFYILLPSHELIQELVDIRDTPKILLMNLGQLLGFPDTLTHFSIHILDKAFDYSYQRKEDGKWNSNIQQIFDHVLPSHHQADTLDALKLDVDFYSQGIRGSMILELSRISRDNHIVHKDIASYSNETLYLQCVTSIFHGNVPVSLQHSIEFAALQYQVYYLFRVSNVESSYCTPMEFISTEYKQIRGISKQILQEHDNLKTYTVSMTMDALIHKYMNLPQSQYLFFNVRSITKTAMKIPKMIPTYFGLSLNGIVYVHPITKRILNTLEFNSLKRWKYTNDAFIYHIGLNDQVTALKTSQGNCISVIVSRYIQRIMDNNLRHKSSSTVNFAQENLGNFNPKIDRLVLEMNDIYDTIY